MGNHEEVFVAAATGDRGAARSLMAMGGATTLSSYGFSAEEIEGGTFQDLADLMLERIPREHVAFLNAGERLLQFGDYLFVHAGIRPGVELHDQTDSDLRWIRRQFLQAHRDDDLLVVHGHTPTHEIDVDVEHGRIGIDTFAYETGILTALGIEEDRYWFLQADAAGGGSAERPNAHTDARRPDDEAS
jgi:serine/threonine protein phosphatase 1